jgi:RecB family exonuclease
MHAAAVANDLASAALELREPVLPRSLLARMVDEAIGPGMADPASAPEAAPWSTVHSPGAMWGPADTVVWWAPSGALAPRTGPWTLAEAKSLAECGCALADGATSMAAAAHSWRQPILHARQRVILVLSKTIGGEEGDDHPLMHELRSALDGAPPGVIIKAENLLAGEQGVAGRRCTREPVSRLFVPAQIRDWAVPAGSVRGPARVSATSIELMLGCRFSWVAQNAANLRPGARASIPSGERLLGLLAHAVARDVFKPGTPPSSERARVRAEATLERLLESEAAPLLLPGNAADLARARAQIPRAIAHLAGRISQAGLAVVGTEIVLPTDTSALSGLELGGRTDMVLEAPTGGRVVLDMKWTGKDKYRWEELVKGRPVQLATYVRLMPSGVPTTAAYYMLAQSRILAADVWPFAEAHVPGSDLTGTWREAAVGWQESWKRIDGGVIEATGLENSGELEPTCALAVDPPCHFCGCKRLCGQKAVA